MASNIRLIRKTGILDSMRRQAPDIVNHIQESNVKGGVVLLKGIMPEKTGEMKRQTEAVKVGKGWGIRIGVDYWRFPNDGTVYIEGEHFVEKAVESIKRGIKQDIINFHSFLK